MAQKQQGVITKIYDMRIVGVPDINKQLDGLIKKYEEVKKAKQGLENQAAKTQDSKEVDVLNKKIQEQIIKEKELTLQIKEQVAQRKKMKLIEEATKNKSFSQVFEDNSINRARQQNKTLISERNLLNSATEEGRKRIEEINVAIDKNNALINKNSSSLEKQRLNIGNYEGSAKIIVEALTKVENKITELKEKQQGLVDFSKKNPIGFKLGGGQDELNKVNSQLETATSQFEALNRVTQNPQFLNVAGKVGDATGEVKFFTKSLVDLERQGLKDSEVYRQVQAQLAKLTDTIADTRASVKALSSDTRQFDLVASGVSTLTSSFQTAAGVSILFGNSQEEVQKKMQFLLAVENVSNGVRAIATDLTTSGTAANRIYSFFQTQVAIATNASSTAMQRFNALLKTGLIGLVIVGIGLLISKISGAASATDELSDAQERNKRIMEAGQNEYVKATSTVQNLKNEISLAKQGFLNKNEVLKDYNESLGKSIGFAKNLDAAEQLITKNAAAYIKATVLKAEANAALSEAARVAFQSSRLLDLDVSSEVQDRITKSGIRLNAQQITQIAEAARAKKLKENEKDIDQLEKLASNLLTKASKISKEKGISFFDSMTAGSSQNKNELSKIDTIRETEIEKENDRVLEIKKLHQLTIDEEIQHLQNIEAINTKALQNKINYLNGQKKLNIDELKSLAQFGREKKETELQIIDDIQAVRDKAFQDQQRILKSQLDRDIEDVRLSAQQVEDDPTSSATAKAQAKLDADNAILALQEKFNADIDILEKKLNQQSKENAQEGAASVRQIKADLNADVKALANAQLEEIETKGQAEIRKEQINFSIQRKAILDNQKLTAKQKQKQLEVLEAAEKRTILSKELDLLLLQLQAKRLLLTLSVLSDEEYQKAYEALVKKSEELSNAIGTDDAKTKEKLKQKFDNLKSFIQSGIRDLFNIDKDSEEDKALGEIISQSYSLAQDAMNNFFDAERNRIQENLDLQLERLDSEKEQVIARAQSQAEIDSLEKQYAAKKRKAQIDAGEQLKKSKKAEAKIALATELANTWVQASQYPFPASLVIGGILTALAVGRYALRVSEINREKFAKGGVPTKKGGVIAGPSHSKGGVPFQYEAEGEELAIINKISAKDNTVRTLTGTNKQIASLINELGGGISFAKGAKLTRFAAGGYLGDQLQAPVFTPSNTMVIHGTNTKVLDAINEQSIALQEQAKSIQAVSNQVKKIEVIQVTSTVTNAQKKAVKQSAINSL